MGKSNKKQQERSIEVSGRDKALRHVGISVGFGYAFNASMAILGVMQAAANVGNELSLIAQILETCRQIENKDDREKILISDLDFRRGKLLVALDDFGKAYKENIGTISQAAPSIIDDALAESMVQLVRKINDGIKGVIDKKDGSIDHLWRCLMEHDQNREIFDYFNRPKDRAKEFAMQRTHELITGEYKEHSQQWAAIVRHMQKELENVASRTEIEEEAYRRWFKLKSKSDTVRDLADKLRIDYGRWDTQRQKKEDAIKNFEI